MKTKRTQSQIFNELIESLVQAEGASSQIIHQIGNPVGFLMIRDALNLTKQLCTKAAPQNVFLAPKTVYIKKLRG